MNSFVKLVLFPIYHGCKLFTHDFKMCIIYVADTQYSCSIRPIFTDISDIAYARYDMPNIANFDTINNC